MVAPHVMVHLCSSPIDDFYGPEFAFLYDVIYVVTIDLFNQILSISTYISTVLDSGPAHLQWQLGDLGSMVQLRSAAYFTHRFVNLVTIL